MKSAGALSAACGFEHLLSVAHHSLPSWSFYLLFRRSHPALTASDPGMRLATTGADVSPQRITGDFRSRSSCHSSLRAGAACAHWSECLRSSWTAASRLCFGGGARQHLTKRIPPRPGGSGGSSTPPRLRPSITGYLRRPPDHRAGSHTSQKQPPRLGPSVKG